MRRSPSGHFPHFWTEGGPICSKVCHGTVSGPTVDAVRRDARSHTISLAHTCMLAASGPFWNMNSYFPRKYSSSRRLSRGNSRIYPPAHETIWSGYPNCIKVSAPVPSHRCMFNMRVKASEYIRSACIPDNNRGPLCVTAHDVHGRSTLRPMANF